METTYKISILSFKKKEKIEKSEPWTYIITIAFSFSDNVVWKMAFFE